MKKSELKNYIKETIVTELNGSINLPKATTNTSDIKKYTSQGIDVNLKEEDIDEITINKLSKHYIIIPNGNDFYSQTSISAPSIQAARKSLEEDEITFTDEKWRKLIIIEGKYIQNNPMH